MSLRAFHLIFILLAIIGADLFGAWSIYQWTHAGSLMILVLGIVSLAGGLGLAGYAGWFVHKMEQAHIQ